MEVHHQSHTGIKKFSQYFLEFLMLFLAVTLGFFAESLRERITEHAKEKEYMSSLASELKYDCAEYDSVMQKIAVIGPLLDSLYNNAKNAQNFQYRLEPRWNTLVNNTVVSYIPSDPTIQQLKNSGNLRLIRDKNVEQKIMVYETYIEGRLKNADESLTEASHKVFAFEDALCDYTDFNRKTMQNLLDSNARKSLYNASSFEMNLLVKDPLKLNEFANSFVNYKAYLYGYSTNTNQAKKIATELLGLIKKVYHID